MPQDKTPQSETTATDADSDSPSSPPKENITISRHLVMINGASSVAARLLNVFGLLWMYQYLLSRISPEEFAIYPVVAAIMVIAPVFFSFFMGSVGRYITASYAQGDFDRVVQIVSSTLPLLGAISLGFICLGLSIACFADSLLVVPPDLLTSAQLMLTMLVINFALQMVTIPFCLGFFIKQRFIEMNLLNVMRDTLRIGLLFTLLIGIEPAVIWVVVAGVSADLVRLAAVLYRSRQLTPEIRFNPKTIHWATATELVSFGLWTTLGSLATVLYTHAATLILNRFGTAVDVTNYHFGATCFQQIQSMIGLARQPLQPALIAMHSLEDHERLARTAIRGGRYGLWVSLMVACPLAIFASEFITLLIGDKFSDAAIVLALFMVIFPFNQPAGLLSLIAVAKAQVRAFNLAAFVNTIIGLGLMVLFASQLKLGAIGVTLALVTVTVVSQLVYFWPLNFQISGMSRKGFLHEVLLPGLMPALGGGLVWLSLKMTIAITGWIALGLAVSAGGIVYLGILLGFCLDKGDRETLTKLTGRLRRS